MSALTWEDVPEFGIRPDTPAVLRPSAYAFIVSEHGLVAVVRSFDGTYLPGGGIDPGETPEQAVVREALEECGFIVRVGSCVGRAIQFATPEAEGICYEKQSYFFEARVEGERPDGIEPGHRTIWVAPRVAHRFVSHESHAWALKAWRMQSRKKR